MRGNKLVILVGTFLLLLSPLLSIEGIPQKSTEISSPFEFVQVPARQEAGIWIWEEYEGAPGPLPGDDVVHWGPSLGPFHNHSEIIEHLISRLIQFPSYVTAFDIGESYHGLPIPCITVTAPGNPIGRLGFLIVAHHHSRETVTVEHALYILDYLLANRALPEINAILMNFVIYIIPSLCPDSLSIIHINPWLRKNVHPVDDDGDGRLTDEFEIQDMNGNNYVERYDIYEYEGIDVDGDGSIGEDLPGGINLNRNYPVAWEEGSADPQSLDYHGLAPFSEPETQAMRNFAEIYGESLSFAISLHTGIEIFLTPWSYTDELPPDQELFEELGEAVEEASGFPWSQLGPVSGIWDDWMYGEVGVPCGTLETYVNHEADSIWDVYQPSANLVMSLSEQVWQAIHAIIEVLMPEQPPFQQQLILLIIGVVCTAIVITVVTIFIRRVRRSR